MAIKRGNAPTTIPARLTIKGAGESNKLELTYFNRKSSEYDDKVAELKESSVPFLPSLVVFLVKEWDTDYSLSIEGVLELEDERSGICEAILQGFWQARRIELEKN
ncbi:hypothetical protein KVP10_08560 [Candidimonas humi]|uniref:Phage tail assembly chaperone n=1 Tax=Candidimonas humi TaxID=683355 RepID=A0ABV8NXK3_9BURK|nr:hypothetical protein [Candidimonas humi]MBV6304938.1 hypothetical protein [Candidimonas humi]